MATARKCPKCGTESPTVVLGDRCSMCVGEVGLELGQQAGPGRPESEISTKSEVPEGLVGTVKVELDMEGEARGAMKRRHQLLPEIRGGRGGGEALVFLLTILPSEGKLFSMWRRNQDRRVSVRGKSLRYRAEYFHKLAFPSSRFGERASALPLSSSGPGEVPVPAAAPYLWRKSPLYEAIFDSLATLTRPA